ncbi:hypothetical protein FE781_13255 [Paenibacillus thermoaerophilus]|nr:hypothetical protein FE781_13255 [Paenibacillus thermoaerophilus]
MLAAPQTAIGTESSGSPPKIGAQKGNNRGFRRFLLRGLRKVSLEVGWLSLARNLLKGAAVKQTGRTQGLV